MIRRRWWSLVVVGLLLVAVPTPAVAGSNGTAPSIDDDPVSLLTTVASRHRGFGDVTVIDADYGGQGTAAGDHYRLHDAGGDFAGGLVALDDEPPEVTIFESDRETGTRLRSVYSVELADDGTLHAAEPTTLGEAAATSGELADPLGEVRCQVSIWRPTGDYVFAHGAAEIHDCSAPADLELIVALANEVDGLGLVYAPGDNSNHGHTTVPDMAIHDEQTHGTDLRLDTRAACLGTTGSRWQTVALATVRTSSTSVTVPLISGARTIPCTSISNRLVGCTAGSCLSIEQALWTVSYAQTRANNLLRWLGLPPI